MELHSTVHIHIPPSVGHLTGPFCDQRRETIVYGDITEIEFDTKTKMLISEWMKVTGHKYTYSNILIAFQRQGRLDMIPHTTVRAQEHLFSGQNTELLK